MSGIKNIVKIQRTSFFINTTLDSYSVLFFKKASYEINKYLYEINVNDVKGQEEYMRRIDALSKLVVLSNTGFGKRLSNNKLISFYNFDINFDFKDVIFNKTSDESIVYFEISHSVNCYHLKRVGNSSNVEQIWVLRQD